MSGNATPIYGNKKWYQKPKSDTPLGAWLGVTGRSRYSFAKLLGCDPKMVGYWADGRCLPDLIYAFKIEQHSEGGVPVASWLGTDLAKIRWHNMGADWDKWNEQRKAEYVRNGARRRKK